MSTGEGDKPKEGSSTLLSNSKHKCRGRDNKRKKVVDKFVCVSLYVCKFVCV